MAAFCLSPEVPRSLPEREGSRRRGSGCQEEEGAAGTSDRSAKKWGWGRGMVIGVLKPAVQAIGPGIGVPKMYAGG